MNYKFAFVSLFCVLLLCSPCFASNQRTEFTDIQKTEFTECLPGNNIKVAAGIDGDRYETHNDGRNISIKLNEDTGLLSKIFKDDEEYHKQTVQIPYTELEGLENFSGFVEINHYTDEGVNDWSKIEYVENVGGYAYLDLEFSTVYITPYVSQVYNYDFEAWNSENTVPTGFIQSETGTVRSEESKINNYSLEFNGSGEISAASDIIGILNPSTVGDYTAVVNLSLPDGTNSDFSNIRFENASLDTVPYWIENKSDGDYANIWLRLSKDETAVYIVNEASSATSESDASAVFYSDDEQVPTDTDLRAPFDVINGGLETLTDWTRDGVTLNTDKKQGTYSYELNVEGDTTGEYFEQYIDVPDWDDDVYIHFWAKGWNPETYGYHNNFYVNGNSEQSIPDTSSWVEYFVDISSYKGTNVPIKWWVYTSNDASDNGAAGRYDDIYITNSSTGNVFEKIVVDPTPVLSSVPELIGTPANYTVGAWIKTENVESGTLNIELSDTTTINVDSQVDEWTWYETRGYISTTGDTLSLYVDDNPNAEASFFVDGVIVSEDYNITATEEEEDRTISQTLTYTPGDYYTNSVFVTEYTDFDITAHGKYNVSVLIDGETVDFQNADNLIYIDTSGLSVEAHNISISTDYNQPPELIYPADDEIINKTFPPLSNDITFEWEDSGTTAQIQVATDEDFLNVLSSETSTTNTVTISLAANTYYWRVRTYDPTLSTYSEYSEIQTFTIDSQPVFCGTGVNGVVYDVESDDAISSAIVQIYNDTWSGDPYLTTSDGYYYFTGLANETTYAVYATKTLYTDSNIYYVTTSNNTYAIKNIPMQEDEGEGVYYEKHYVRFIVTDTDYSDRYQATVEVFIGDSTDSQYTQISGSDGAVGFWLDQKTRYRIETTYNGETQIDYVTPTDEEYYIFLEWLGTDVSIIPADQFIDVVNVTVTKDDDTGLVAIYYDDSLEQTETLKFQIGQTENNGTYTVIDESEEYTNTNTKIQSFTLTDYIGEDYRIKVIIDHGSFGSITKDYGVSFPGNSLPFGKPVSYLCVLVLLVCGMQFGSKDTNSGALLVCGLASMMWYMDVFEPFGSGINTLMGIGLGMAILYAIIAYINKKRQEEAI